MLKSIVQSTLRVAGYELQKFKPKIPHGRQIDVFSLCLDELLKSVERPFVLQIGANDGVRADPVRPFIVAKRLPALLIEPHPLMFQILQSNYTSFKNVRLLNAAISDSDGSISLYSPDKALIEHNQKLSGLCSLSKSQLIKELTRESVANPASRISEIQVAALSVASLLRDNAITTVDVLQIDTEGFDWNILKQFDLSALNVKLLNMEFFHLSDLEKSECLTRLEALGYEVAFVFGDLVARLRS